MTNFRTFSLWCLCAACLQGCTVFQTMKQGTQELVKTLTPQSFDEEHPADDPGDPWIAAAGREGRQDQEGQMQNDPLHLRQYVISPKARSIENNLGIAEDER